MSAFHSGVHDQKAGKFFSTGTLVFMEMGCCNLQGDTFTMTSLQSRTSMQAEGTNAR